MSRFKKFSASILVAIVLFTSIGGSLMFPSPARAIPVEILADPVGYVMYLLGEMKDTVKAALLAAGSRAATYALRRVAYDSAVWVASGGKGQGPLAHTKGFGGYLKDVGNDVAGAAIEAMGTSAGLDLCKIPDIKVDLALRIGLRTKYAGAPRKPNCTLSQFTENWGSGEAWSKYTSKEGLGKTFSASITADDSDLGIYLAATEKINNIKKEQTDAAILNRQEGQGYKPMTTLISDQIKTPAKNVGETSKALNPQTQFDSEEAKLNAALASGDGKVFPAVLSLFLSTLGGTIINNFQTKGILPIIGCVTGSCSSGTGVVSGGSNNSIFNESGSGLSGLGRAAAQSFFSYFTQIKIKETTRYDLLSQLNSCPEAPGVYNCRAGDDLVNAASQGLTIGEAIKLGILDGSRRLISPDSDKYKQLNNDLNCYQTAYCFSNVKVLRQVRVLPLGFEIAVKNSDVNIPWTLKEVVDNFDQCPATSTAFDPEAHKYCHLIDPNWVLKIPDAKCNALAYTNTLISGEAPNRIQDCVDLQTCVNYSPDGNCVDYAYCTKEKNTWKFSAESCYSQFATCKTFEGSSGRAVSYLTRTLDNGYCNQDNVGCTAYSLSKDAAGNWLDPSFDIASVSNRGIYLNSQAANSTCSTNSAGCSAFKVATSSGETVYLKKAPAYLGCYDSDPATPATTNWPQTESDLSRVSSNPECSKYAKACIPDEAACNWYKPLIGGDSIPGKFIPAVVSGNTVTWNDQCDAKCDGYNSYSEMPSNYSNGNPLSYIIPKSGKTCAAQDEGCSAFTNLSQSSGAETIEYYSFLRPCITMSEATSANTKTFITYEGTKESGFQLRTYIMQFNNNDAANGPNGSPKYIFKDPAELSYLNSECTEQRYKDGVASLDCRQFNDQNGNIYYRMLSHTVPAHEKCTGYRLNDAEFYDDTSVGSQLACDARSGHWDTSRNVCELCIQNGIYRSGGCVYQGIPAGNESFVGSSRSCAASVATCRAFKGNAGNNVQTIFNETFEDANATTDWSAGVSVVAVSTHVGGHSLEYDNNNAFSKTLSLEPGKSYDITFWAMASQGSNVDVSLVSGSTQNLGTISVSNVWKQYRLGPVEYNGTNPTGQLTFNHSVAGPLFLDNIKVVKVASYLYLVKDSLSVDPICDSNQTDNLPGEALGCTAYKDPQNRTFYLTNFSFLCREDAIGCTALVDTYNNDSVTPEAYRVWVVGAPGQVITQTIGTDDYSCTVENKAGNNGCYLSSSTTPEVIRGHSYAEISAVLPNGFVSSTIYIPGDTTSTPIFLVANKSASCAQTDLGCSIAGMKTYSNGIWKYATTTIKNDPSKYANILCESQAQGCNAYSNDEEVYYFKDPESSGQNLCEYKTNVPYSTGANAIDRVNGWFKKGNLGTCSNDTSIVCDKTVELSCGAGNICQSEPCYPDYYMNNAQSTEGYGVYSYGSVRYQNYVAECPSDQNTCSEFRDYADMVSTTPKSYFLKKNEKFSSGDCNGQVSQKAGCAIFDEVSNPVKIWNTSATYALSNSLGGVYVTPSSSPTTNDANIIIKVVQDRECGEWLKCQFSFSNFDEQTNNYEPKCKGNLQRCTPNQTSAINPFCAISSNGNLLTVDSYRYRSTGWYDLDYDGYSILNIFPIELLDQVNFAATSTDPVDMRLVMKARCEQGNANYTNCATTGSGLDYTCAVNGAACGLATNPGTCVNGTCYQNLNGTRTEPVSQICRAYPEVDSPFPNTQPVINSSYYKGANICNTLSADGKSCECDYQKVQYGDLGTKYWNSRDVGIYKDRTDTFGSPWTTNTSPPLGVCMGGTVTVGTGVESRNNHECDEDSDCGMGGYCQILKQKNSFIGWRGFCLETDDTRHQNADKFQNTCITWFPVETLDGAPDINNQHTEAGTDWHTSSVSSGGYYCVNGSGSTNSVSFDIDYSPSGIKDLPTDPDGLYGVGINPVNVFGTTVYTITSDPPYGEPALYLVARRCRNKLCFSNKWTEAFQYSRNHVNTASPANRILLDSSNQVQLRNIRQEDIESVTITVLDAGDKKNTAVNTKVTYYNFPISDPVNTAQPNYQVYRSDGNPLAYAIGGFYPNYNGNFVYFYTQSTGGGSEDVTARHTDLALTGSAVTVNEWAGPYAFHGAKRYGLVGDMAYTSSLPLYAVNPSTNARVDIWDTSLSNDYYRGSSATGTVIIDPISQSQYDRRDFFLRGSYIPSYIPFTDPDPNMVCDPEDPSSFSGDTCFGPGSSTSTPFFYYFDHDVADILYGDPTVDTSTDTIRGFIRILSPTNTPLISPNPTTTAYPDNRLVNPNTGLPGLTWSQVDTRSDPLAMPPPNSGVANWGACPAYDQQPEGRSYLERDKNTHEVWNALRLTFDPTTNLFTGIDTAFCGAQYQLAYGVSGEWETGRYQDHIKLKVTIKLRRWCSAYVNGTYDPLNPTAPKVIPWTDRLFNVPNSDYQSVPDLGITYSSSTAPYGNITNANLNPNAPIVLDRPAPSPCVGQMYQTSAGTSLGCDAEDSKYDPANIRAGERFSVTTNQYGIDHLSSLFASVYDPHVWRRSSGWSYVGDASLNFNVTETGDILNTPTTGQNPTPPQIHPLGARVVNSAGQSVNNFELSASGFSIEEQTGDLRFEESSKVVSLDFFMYANPNQMPIRKVSIDWDDGRTISPADGFFRNRRGLYGDPANPESHCKPATAGATGAADFGSILDRTCDNGYFHAENSYSCFGNNPLHLETNGAVCDPLNPGNYPNGCCIFVPKVQIKDNWGWCNGSCGNSSSPGGTNCFDSSWVTGTGTDECMLNNTGPWTSYNGRVILKYQP